MMKYTSVVLIGSLAYIAAYLLVQTMDVGLEVALFIGWSSAIVSSIIGRVAWDFFKNREGDDW